jgi:hypothetical protein
VLPCDFVISIDLESAYYHVDVAKATDKCFLDFSVHGITMQPQRIVNEICPGRLRGDDLARSEQIVDAVAVAVALVVRCHSPKAPRRRPCSGLIRGLANCSGDSLADCLSNCLDDCLVTVLLTVSPTASTTVSRQS